MAKAVKPSMGCGYVVFVFLLAGGLGLLGVAANQFERSGRMTKHVLVPGIVGGLLAAGALAYLRLARRLVFDAEAELAIRNQFPDQPWKWKKAWRGPAISADGDKTAWALWVFALFWNAISWAVVGALLHQGIRKPGEYFVFLFPLVGAGLLWAAIYLTIRARKFGRSRFVPSSLPGVIGGYLGGVIEVPARVVLEADARLTLKCVRRETRGSGKNRHTTDNVLWEREERIAREKWVSGFGGTRIPVLFYIPAESLATDDSDRNNEVVWRLAAEAATPGVDFATRFVVPVFATGETAAPPEPGAPLLEEYSALTLDAGALQACGVRREGDTFHFSTGHLPGTRFVTAVLTLGFLGLLGWFATEDIPGVVWGVTLFFGLIVALLAASVWFGRYEVRIEARDVVVSKRRPWGTAVTRVPRAEVDSVRSEKSMSSGENRYFCLSLVGTAGVNPGAAGAQEPFRVRKLRYQLGRLKKKGQLSPGQEKTMGEQILAELARQPKFTVPIAKHIPGQARAEGIGALVMGAIKAR